MPSKLLSLVVGTYTRRESFVDGKADGIYSYRVDPVVGDLTYIATTGGLINPSFLAISPRGNHLYAVNEIGGTAGESGRVSALAIEPITNALTTINSQSSQGASPCHVAVDPSGRYLLTANYGSGNLCVLPIREDGWLEAASDVVQLHGSGPHERQEGPHAHMITAGPQGRLLFAVDLGSDRIWIYRLDLDRGKLIPADPPWIKLAPGTGPRQLTFHPNGRFAYVIGELNSTVTVFHFDGEQGTLQAQQTVSTLPEGYGGDNLSAEIQVVPSGKFVYASNRGHDSITIYAVDQVTGRLTIAGHEPTRGKYPRHFVVDPSGTFLLVANQDSDSIIVFKMDSLSGKLQMTGQIGVPTPVCLIMIQAR